MLFSMWKLQGKWEAESIVNSYGEADTVIDSSYHFVHCLPAQQLLHVQKGKVFWTFEDVVHYASHISQNVFSAVVNFKLSDLTHAA